MLLSFIFALIILTTSFINFIIAVVVVAIRKANRTSVNLLIHHERLLPRVLKRINIHLNIMIPFNLLLDGMELGRAWHHNISIWLLFAISKAIVDNAATGLIYDLNGLLLLIICVIISLAVILILHLIVLGLLIDILFLLILNTFVYLINIDLLVFVKLLHLNNFNSLFPFVYLISYLLFLLFFLAGLQNRFGILGLALSRYVVAR